MIASCDPDRSVPAKKKKEVFVKFIGAVLHDFHTMSETSWKEKWTTFLPLAYNSVTKEQFKRIANVGNKRATITSRIAGVSENVSLFLNGDLESDDFVGCGVNYSSEEESD